MSTYIFVLGKDRDLSLAELAARFPKSKFLVSGNDFAILDMEQAINQSEFNCLGGVIKVGEVTEITDRDGVARTVKAELMRHHKGSKLDFGVSVYGWPEKNLRSLLIGLRKDLSKEGKSSRFANQNFLNLTTAQHKGIQKKGVELLVAKSQDEFFVGPVVGIQDIDAYGVRDFEKPFRNMKVGMLPPKLAQMMINLTGVEGKIWDPFCGTGTLVMEGLLMGHDMLGSDIDARVLEGAKKNIDWLIQVFGVTSKAELFAHDATQALEGKSFDAIAAEGYLGPPQPPDIDPERLVPLISDLTRLYAGFFSALKKMNCKKPVVIALPFFRCRGGREVELTDAIRQIESLGFKMGLPLRYARPDQSVGRMICRFVL